MDYQREPVATETPRENQSGFFQCVLRDQDGALVPASALATLTLTLYCIENGKFDGKIINTRDRQDVLGVSKTGQNGVTFPTVDGVEHMRWDWSKDDQPVFDGSLEAETHIATFKRTWGPDGLGRGDSFDVRFEVGRVHKV